MSQSFIKFNVLYKGKKNPHLCHVCGGDIKVIGFLLGLQEDDLQNIRTFSDKAASLCLWDSCVTSKHYVFKDWPKRDTFTPGKKIFSIVH